MSLVSQAVAMIGRSRPRTDSDRLKRISSSLRQIAGDETILLDPRFAHRSGSQTEGDIVLEYEDQFRTDQQMLWIDGVGGYLICLSDEIMLGQPNLSSSTNSTAPSGDANTISNISLLADLSKRHIGIRREAGGYLLLPHGSTKINGREVEIPTRLDDGAEITLRDSVQLRFTRPHALSSTALLTVVSDHRTDPAADGIVLMAESCVLGPKSHSHLRCPRWEDEVILFRSSQGLLLRSTSGRSTSGRSTSGGSVKGHSTKEGSAKEPSKKRGAKTDMPHTGILHNGLATEEPVALLPNSRIEGQDFSLSIEGVIKGKDS